MNIFRAMGIIFFFIYLNMKIGLPTAALTILIYVYILHVFYAWATRLKRNIFFEMRLEVREESKKIQMKELRIWKRVAKIGLAIYIPAFIYFIAVIQGFNYAEYAINRNELLRGQGLEKDPELCHPHCHFLLPGRR